MIDSEMIVKFTFNGSLNLLKKMISKLFLLLKKNERQKAVKYNLANSSLNKRHIGKLTFKNKLSFHKELLLSFSHGHNIVDNSRISPFSP